MRALLLAASFFFLPLSMTAQDASIRIGDTPVAANPGIGVNISPRVSGSWQGATFLAQMCRDGSFEGPVQEGGDDAGVISGWKKFGEGGQYSVDAEKPYKGRQAQKMQLSEAWSGLQNWRLKWQLNRANEYTITMAVRAENYDSHLNIRLRYWNSNEVQFSPDFVPGADWRLFEWTFRPAVSDELGELYIQGYGPGELYIDDFRFYITANYRPEDGLDQRFLDYLRDFKPAALRWGGIGANFDGGFSGNTGPHDERDDMSYGDFFRLCELVGAQANLVLAVDENQDFYRDPRTVQRLVEYIGGAPDTEGGALRASENHDEFLSSGKGFIIEFGNEVWGSEAHGAPWSQDTRQDYIAWTRERMKLMRATPEFDPEKYRLVYCGRRANYQWWDRWNMIDGEDGEGDWWAISGYLDGNSNQVLDGRGQISYLLSGLAYTHWYAGQVAQHYIYMKETIGKRLPLFIYEGNFDLANYFHRLGQAVVYLDFTATMIRSGIAMPMLFHFATGGQWGLVNNVWGNYKRQPLYYAGMLFNNYCLGDMLSSNSDDAAEFTHPGWNDIPEQTFELVGHYAFKQDQRYSILLINRDLAEERSVRLQLPARDFNAEARLYSLDGEGWNDFNPYEDFNADEERVTIRESLITDFGDSFELSLPALSAQVLVFDAADRTDVDESIPPRRGLLVESSSSREIRLRLEDNSHSSVMLRLFDARGSQLVQRRLRPDGEGRLLLRPPAQLAAGVYLVTVREADGRTSAATLLITSSN